MGNILSLQYGLLLSHCAIGLVAARLAHQKGHDLGKWLLWGTVGGTAALVHSLVIPRQARPQ